jgi:integrase
MCSLMGRQRPVSSGYDQHLHARLAQDSCGHSHRGSASPLAKVPYHLRHAAVSLWLNAGVPATQVAEWAGHSVAVLLKVYAQCIDGQEDAARKRVAAALAGSAQPTAQEGPAAAPAAGTT